MSAPAYCSRPSAVSHWKVNTSLDTARDVAIGPAEGSRPLVVGADIAHEFARQVAFGGEDAAGDQIALHLGEPDFDLIEPGGVSRRVMQRDPGVLDEKLLDRLGLMSGKIIGDEMQLFTFRRTQTNAF